MSDNRDVNNTQNRILQHFYPGKMRKCGRVAKTCHMCHAWQIKSECKTCPGNQDRWNLYQRSINRLAGCVLLVFACQMPYMESAKSSLLVVKCAPTTFPEDILLRKISPQVITKPLSNFSHKTQIWNAQRNSIWPKFQFHIWSYSTNNSSLETLCSLANV